MKLHDHLVSYCTLGRIDRFDQAVFIVVGINFLPQSITSKDLYSHSVTLSLRLPASTTDINSSTLPQAKFKRETDIESPYTTNIRTDVKRLIKLLENSSMLSLTNKLTTI